MSKVKPARAKVAGVRPGRSGMARAARDRAPVLRARVRVRRASVLARPRQATGAAPRVPAHPARAPR
ncbi:MAG TPA: hypothetical protein VKU39_00705, partial [Streptosporangiaceae bacterium]|nr:hypothetical protein [Streptosporangiaceae bacterium]